MKIQAPLLAVISGLTLFACATLENTEDKPRGIAAFEKDVRLGPAVDKICFKRNIDGFRNATKDTVVLDAGVRDEYIVEVHGSCFNLRNAQAIQLDSNLSCLSKFDNLIVYDSAFGTRTSPNSVERCSIKSIYKWDEKAESNEEELIDPSMQPIK